MDQIRTILPDARHDLFDSAVSELAPGTPLREAIDMIISAQNGALICIGDVKAVLAIGNGGFKIDVAFTPQKLFELSKMDGAIVLSEDCKQIIQANFHLHPDPSIGTQETGMRHRSAARTSAQTEAVVIAISKRRTQTTIYRNGQCMTLEPEEILLSRSNQGLLALQNAKENLEKAALRQSFLELDDNVNVLDVSKLLTRYINVVKLAGYTDRNINYLGSSSGLLRNQLDETTHGVADSFILTIRDYAKSSTAKEAKKIAQALIVIPHAELDTQRIMETLGYTGTVCEEDLLHPRGFRVMSRVSMLDEAAASRIIDKYDSLSDLLDDSGNEYDRNDLIGIQNLRSLASTFRQVRNTL